MVFIAFVSNAARKGENRMASDKVQKFCPECHRTLKITSFYASNDIQKYPDGHLNTCKNCITLNVDNWDPETFLPILKECDVPYIPKVWFKKLQNFAQDPTKVSGVSIIGRYLSTMRIKPNDKWRYKDTEYLQECDDKLISESLARQGADAAEIDRQLRATHDAVDPSKHKPAILQQEEDDIIMPTFSSLEEIESDENPQDLFSVPGFGPPVDQPISEDTQFTTPPPADYFDQNSKGYDKAIEKQLTAKDRDFLRLKWGKTYKPEEWVKLEQLYQEMCKSYDIQSAGHEDVLKLVCKTSLKANQLLDIGDVDGAQKMVKMYDSLMKSGKFTAAQNKAEDGEYLNSISEFVTLCEQEGFIPRFYINQPNDVVDATIADMKDYTRRLVVEEMNLGNLIENAVKQMALEESKIELGNEDDEDTEELLLRDKDFSDFSDFVGNEKLTDEEAIQSFLEQEEFDGASRST